MVLGQWRHGGEGGEETEEAEETEESEETEETSAVQEVWIFSFGYGRRGQALEKPYANVKTLI